MTPPRPWIIWVILAALTLVNLPRALAQFGGGGSGFESGRELGYLIGTIALPLLLGVLYSRWYRRRTRRQ